MKTTNQTNHLQLKTAAKAVFLSLSIAWLGGGTLARAGSDFDGDGVDDLAIGTPNEKVGQDNQAGVVNVLYGVRGQGLTARRNQLIANRATDLFPAGTDPVNTAGGSARFGTALIAADFGGDGIADLAVGAPEQNVIEEITGLEGGDVLMRGAGSATLIGGVRRAGLGGGGAANSRSTLSQVGTFEGNAFVSSHFGQALAAGDFDGNGQEELAVGIPQSNNDDEIFFNNQGAVLIVQGNDLLTQSSPGIDDEPEAGDDFGDALAAGDFNGDGFDDLVVGVPGEELDATPIRGAINVIFGSTQGLAKNNGQFFHKGVAALTSGPDRFGGQMSVGDYNGDGFDDLSIASTAATVDGKVAAGVVRVIYGSGNGLNANVSQLWHLDVADVEGDAEKDGNFGSGLASGDFNRDGIVDLAVGARGETVSGTLGAGAIHILFGSPNRLTANADQLISQATPDILDDPSARAGFGNTLFAGDFNADGFADLATGVRGKNNVQVIYGGTAGLQAVGNQVWNQDSFTIDEAGRRSDVLGAKEPGDGFGLALPGSRDIDLLPGFAATWQEAAVSCPNAGTRCRVTARLTIENPGVATADRSETYVFISDDEQLDERDVLIKKIRVKPLKFQQNRRFRWSVSLPASPNPAGKFLIAVLDATNAIDEANEDNNKVAVPLSAP